MRALNLWGSRHLAEEEEGDTIAYGVCPYGSGGQEAVSKSNSAGSFGTDAKESTGTTADNHISSQRNQPEEAAVDTGFVPGWESDSSGSRYRDSGTTCKKNEFFKVDNQWYYADGAGYIVTGRHHIGDDEYCFDESGHMITGWQQHDGQWYYFEASGHMTTGWQQIGDDWYYLNADGRMQTGLCQIDGVLYYFDESGKWDGNSYQNINEFLNGRG